MTTHCFTVFRKEEKEAACYLLTGKEAAALLVYYSSVFIFITPASEKSCLSSCVTGLCLESTYCNSDHVFEVELVIKDVPVCVTLVNLCVVYEMTRFLSLFDSRHVF